MIEQITDAMDCQRIMETAGYPEKWPQDLPPSSEYHVVLGAYCPDLVGCFPVNYHHDCAEIHAAFLKPYRGQFAIESAREAFHWIWENTAYHRIVAEIEAPHIKRYAERCGMKFTGSCYEVKKWAAL